jgi:hypothetical protein
MNCLLDINHYVTKLSVSLLRFSCAYQFFGSAGGTAGNKHHYDALVTHYIFMHQQAGVSTMI